MLPLGTVFFLGLFPEFFIRVAMSSTVAVYLGESMVARQVSWTSAVSLFRFVWAVQQDSGVGSGPRSDSSRVALAVWIRKLDVIAIDSGSGAPASSTHEAMLNWFFTSLRCGCTPKDVMVWLFPVFDDLFFQTIMDGDVEG
jgi:hypothetical protein